jgi:hypothetical protein
MVMDECLLRVSYGLLNGMELLGKFDAVPASLNHGNRAAQVTLRALQAKNYVRMGFVKSFLIHARILSKGIGSVNMRSPRFYTPLTCAHCADSAIPLLQREYIGLSNVLKDDE